MEVNFDDLSAEAALSEIADKHDGVAERLDTLQNYEGDAEAARDAAEELDLDDTGELSDAVAMKDEKIETLEEKVEELEDELDDARRPQMEEDAEFIAERTDRFGDDVEDVIDNLDEDPETIADKRELVEDLTEGYDEQTANPGDEEGSESTPTTDGYARTPWN